MATELDDIDDLSDLGDLGDLDIGDIDGLDTGDKPSAGRKGGLLKDRMKLAVLSTVALIVLGAGLYFLTDDGSSANMADGMSDEDDEDDDDDERRSTPYYFTLDPAFVVNFVGRGHARFLQVNIEGLTRDPSIKEDITTHLPHIRNNIVLLLSSKTYDELITAEGKENLRKEILSEVKKILRKEAGKDEIEDVYFTSFVMQ